MNEIMTNAELCKWLCANSSGIYRPAAEAAGVIERQDAEIDRLRQQLGECSGGFESGTRSIARQQAEIERLRVATLQGLAHVYQGECPDKFNWTSRDKNCPACQLLNSLEHTNG